MRAFDLTLPLAVPSQVSRILFGRRTKEPEFLAEFWERRLASDDHLITVAARSEVELGEDVQLLLRCIDDLGALEKALVLLYLDGNDHASIAEVLGISVSNVGTKLFRIKDRLRVALEERARSNHKERPHAAR